MAKKKSTPSASEMNNNLLRKLALEKMVEHNRDYLQLDITIPLGNRALKQVHTNQWLFTDLPKEFDLANWTILAKALNSSTNRYEGYIKNKWYIESVDITVNGNTTHRTTGEDGKCSINLSNLPYTNTSGTLKKNPLNPEILSGFFTR